MFENYPSTLEAIDAQIHEEQARADSLFQSEETVSVSVSGLISRLCIFLFLYCPVVVLQIVSLQNGC